MIVRRLVGLLACLCLLHVASAFVMPSAAMLGKMERLEKGAFHQPRQLCDVDRINWAARRTNKLSAPGLGAISLFASAKEKTTKRAGSSSDDVSSLGGGGLKGVIVGSVIAVLHLLRDIWGQIMVFLFDTFINRPFLNILNKVEISNHKRLTDSISKRKRGQPLITVSNHQSSMDEPLLFSAIIPWPIKQWQLRYSLCNDNMFYSMGPIMAQLFFYAARGLPIWRSKSMDQPSFREFCLKAQRGGWCHIFPEGRLWQPWKLRKEGRLLGDLKPGVGKLVATCETSRHPAIILPFYHTGMHRIYPQFPDSKKQSLPPKTGNTVRVRIGEPIDMSDLIEAHKESRDVARKELGLRDSWKTTPADQELYKAIAERIEVALTDLAKQVDQDIEWATHPSVLPGGSGG